MNRATFCVVCVCFAIAASGCSQKQVRAPAPSQGTDYSNQSQISEQPLEKPVAQSGDATRPSNLPPSQMPFQGAPIKEDGLSAQNTVLPSIEYVNDRIFEYGRKLESWKELDKQSVVVSLSQEQTEAMVRCFRDLQKVLSGYERLHDDMLQRNILSESIMFDAREAMDLQKMDIAFLESVCGRLLAGSDDKAAGWQERQQGADLNQIETLIERYASSKEYDEVVQVWLQIPEYQVERIDLRTKILYGNALMYLNQQEKAAEIYQQIVDEMSVSKEQPTDLLSLRRILADLYTASGNYLAAEGQYDQISSDYLTIGQIDEWSKLQLSILERSSTGSPELKEFSSLIRGYLGFLPERDGYKVVWESEKFLENYPYSPVASNVDSIKLKTKQMADEWLNQFFTQVATLVQEKKFQDAIELLQTIPEDIIGTENILEVKTKIDELILAEAVERETVKLDRMTNLQRRWNEGMVVADQDDFDGAIRIFTELLDTEYNSKAQVKIKELSLQAAKADRRKAADLFIRFTKTTDVESQKKLLLESRWVLKEILVKYPDVEIGDKVIGNISRVEKEMNEIDPMLLPAVELEELEKRMGQPDGQERQPETDVFDMPLSPRKANSNRPQPVSQPVIYPTEVQ